MVIETMFGIQLPIQITQGNNTILKFREVKVFENYLHGRNYFSC